MLPTVNSRIDLDLRGVYGFSYIVLRIIATYDAILSDRRGALKEVERRLGRVAGPARAHAGQQTQTRRIDDLLRQAFLPRAVHSQSFITDLKGTNRIPAYW
jgi:hypothetical protein